MFSIVQKDFDNYEQHIKIMFNSKSFDSKIILDIYFYADDCPIGQSQLNFLIVDNKIVWDSPAWLSSSTIDFCNKLVKMKAFV